LYGFSSDVLPVSSSPSEDILILVDSPDMTLVAYVQLKLSHLKIFERQVQDSNRMNQVILYITMILLMEPAHFDKVSMTLCVIGQLNF
jgi:hypothetical protein